MLSSEATDLELEMIDLSRQVIKQSLGDVAIGNAWKVTMLNSTQLLISPGEAWVNGLPFNFRFGKDELVSGNNLAIGIVPSGVTVSDEPNGLGKILTFNPTIPSPPNGYSVPPTNTYRIVVSAQEQLITNVQDPFLQNVNLTESTALKLRLLLKINVVQDSAQTNTPTPYTDENSTPVNLQNTIVVTPAAGLNGELVSVNTSVGSQQLDGRTIELTIRNNPSLGGGNPLPSSPPSQADFQGGTLIDSHGSRYYINAIFPDPSNTANQVVIRLAQEYGQPAPEIVNGSAYTVMKRDVYAQDDSSGAPLGIVYWPIAKASWNASTNFVHSSVVTDLRNFIDDQGDFQDNLWQKSDLTVVGGGSIALGNGTGILSWSSAIELINAYGPIQSIAAGSAGMIDGGSLVYEMNLASGGAIAKGTISTNVLNTGTTLNVSALTNLSSVRIGNIIGVGTQLVKITAVDNTAKQLQVATAVTNTGAATIYLDSFAPSSAKITENSYVLGVMRNGKVWINGGSLELESGESSEIGDGISDQLLTYIGATSEIQSAPVYGSTYHLTQGSPLNSAISQLDTALHNVDAELGAPLYDERILYPFGLASGTHIVLPNNTRNGNAAQFYVPGAAKLVIYVNQLIKFAGIDYNEIDNQHIAFTFNLPQNAEVRFRDAVLGGGGGTGTGGGGGTLQDAYNLGPSILTTSGNPVYISGVGGKLLHVAGDVQIDGMIDPTGLQLSPQSSNPLSSGQQGIWVNTSNELNYHNGTISTNLIQLLTNLQAGTGQTGISRYMFNCTASTIPAGSPVYSPSAGNIDLADGVSNSRIIGVTPSAIAPMSTGLVTYAGMIAGITGFTHGSQIYLSTAPGVMTETKPTIGSVPSGFNVVIVGTIEGTNLMLQIQDVGII